MSNDSDSTPSPVSGDSVRMQCEAMAGVEYHVSYAGDARCQCGKAPGYAPASSVVGDGGEAETLRRAQFICERAVEHGDARIVGVERASLALIVEALRSTRAALEEARAERDSLVSELADVAGWSDRSYLHAALHVRNLVLNLRADVAAARSTAPEGTD